LRLTGSLNVSVLMLLVVSVGDLGKPNLLMVEYDTEFMRLLLLGDENIW
jgi:hypothetical protein